MFCGKRRKLEFWTYISQLTAWDCGIDMPVNMAESSPKCLTP